MAEAIPLESQERRFLPVVARVFTELGYEKATLLELARRCGTNVNDLKACWPNKAAIFIAAIEYAYESAERVWTLLLHPNARSSLDRLRAFASECGSEFALSRLLMVGLDQTEEPRIRNTLRRMNRRLARFLASEIADLHIDALAGEVDQTALRAQAGVVLRDLARIQQLADDDAQIEQMRLIEHLNQAVRDARDDRAPEKSQG